VLCLEIPLVGAGGFCPCIYTYINETNELEEYESKQIKEVT
jgi:hypothetical protein